MVGGKNEHPNFVIEKRVRYDLIRGWPMYTVYQIIGGFHKDQSGKTTLQYGVSGQGAVPLFHAAIIIIALLAITLLLGSFVFSPATNANWIAVLLMGVLLLSAVGYGVFAYRSYQGHLKELDHFMQQFAQGNF